MSRKNYGFLVVEVSCLCHPFWLLFGRSILALLSQRTNAEMMSREHRELKRRRKRNDKTLLCNRCYILLICQVKLPKMITPTLLKYLCGPIAFGRLFFSHSTIALRVPIFGKYNCVCVWDIIHFYQKTEWIQERKKFMWLLLVKWIANTWYASAKGNELNRNTTLLCGMLLSEECHLPASVI